MARFVKGDVVVIPFPISDLSQAKRRPALVLTNLEGDDLILCQITSQQVRDPDKPDEPNGLDRRADFLLCELGGFLCSRFLSEVRFKNITI